MSELLQNSLKSLSLDTSREYVEKVQVESDSNIFKLGSSNTNLLINYLPQDIDDSALASLFAVDGEIISAKVVRDKSTKKSLGYGFVKFSDENDALNCIKNKNGFIIGQKRLKVSFARPASEDIKNCKIYVTNLPKSFSEENVKDLFSDVS